jgi:RES domain-containing protein
VTYFGETASIVVLEKLAHLDPVNLESDLILGEFEGDVSAEDGWPAELTTFEKLADIDWCREQGDRWLERNSSCVLRVPSVLLPEEKNFLFNPRHSDAARLVLVRERPFVFDGRLLQ